MFLATLCDEMPDVLLLLLFTYRLFFFTPVKGENKVGYCFVFFFRAYCYAFLFLATICDEMPDILHLLLFTYHVFFLPL